MVRLDAPIYFANIQWMEDKLVQYEADALRWVGKLGAACKVLCREHDGQARHHSGTSHHVFVIHSQCHHVA